MGNEEERQRGENETCEWSTGQVLGDGTPRGCHPGFRTETVIYHNSVVVVNLHCDPREGFLRGRVIGSSSELIYQEVI